MISVLVFVYCLTLAQIQQPNSVDSRRVLLEIKMELAATRKKFCCRINMHFLQ